MKTFDDMLWALQAGKYVDVSVVLAKLMEICKEPGQYKSCERDLFKAIGAYD